MSSTPETHSPPADTLLSLARHLASAHPGRTGFTFLTDGEADEQDLTYAELDSRARSVAARLAQSCRPGEHVLLVYEPGLDYVASFFACQYAGMVPVPAYPPDLMRSDRTLSRLRAIVADCGASVALGSGRSPGAIGTVLPSSLGLRAIIPTDDWQQWQELPWEPPAVRPGDVALLQYTSGSTATPRGVMVTHRNLWHQFANMAVVDGEDSVGVSWLPLYHDLGLIGLLAGVYFRRRVVLLSPLAFVQRPLRWLQAVSKYRGTTTGGPNFALDMCVGKFSAAEAEGLDLSSLRVMLLGAEAIRAETLDRFAATFAPYGLREDVWYPCYGLAEATLGVTGVRHGSQFRTLTVATAALGEGRVVPAAAGEPARRLVGCGPAVEGSEVVIADPATAAELPGGQVGEVWVRGPNVALGYWNRPVENEAVFHARLAGAAARGEFLRTGDFGFLHGGQLYLTGRLKEVMIFWGRNVYPQDVEATCSACHPLLKENGCAAFAVERDGRELLAVVQEVSRPTKLDLEAVAGNVRQAVEAEHQVPLHALAMIRAGTLPKTSSGKIQRHVAREKFLAGDLAVIQKWEFPSPLEGPGAAGFRRELPPRGEIEAWLRGRIARHCGLPEAEVRPEASLQQYVADSVSVVSIALDLQQWVGRAISPAVLYDTPTLAVLAERLTDPASYIPGASPNRLSIEDLTEGELDQALAQLLRQQPGGPPAAGPWDQGLGAGNGEQGPVRGK